MYSESTYQETAPSTIHRPPSAVKDESMLKCPPKRLRSMEKESTTSYSTSRHHYS